MSRWQSSAAGILSSSQLSTELSQGGRHCIRATWSTPDHRGPGPLRPVPLILLLPEGLALPSCCSPGLSLSPPRREKPPSLHVSSSFHTWAGRGPLMLQRLQFYHQLSEKAFLGRVYYVSSNKELYFHHCFSCPGLSALWLGVSSTRAIWYNG